MIIEVFPDYVLINGQQVSRPSRIAPSQWIRFWENMSRKRSYIPHYESERQSEV